MNQPEPVDYEKLLPSLADCNDGQGISIDGYLRANGSFHLAIAFTPFFWPEFVEHDGCILRAGFSPDTYDGFMAQCKGDRSAVENVMNHRHLLDLFPNNSEEATVELFLHLGRVLQEIWHAKLTRDFPSRRFEVAFHHDRSDDLLDYVVTFWQPTNRAAL